ncbi:MAG: helix-turn-helix domain-containing protein [Candidatus Altimarinota bacterium]
MIPISIRGQSCPNTKCSQYGEHEKANQIRIHSQKEKRLQCKVCRKTWVAHRNEALYRIKSPSEKILRFQALYEEGSSIREIANRINVSPSTIQRWCKHPSLLSVHGKERRGDYDRRFRSEE